jgi:hypothetical protein
MSRPLALWDVPAPARRARGPRAALDRLLHRAAGMSFRARVASIAALVATAVPGASHAQYDPSETRPAMQRIYAQLRQVLPLAVDEEVFADPANQPKVREALRTLAREADLLDDHAKGFDPGAAHLARSLSRDVRQALQRYEHADYLGAGYFLFETTGACVTCHSRLPGPQDSQVSRGFLELSQLRELPLLERARLQIATRRFDDAIASLESALLGAEPAALELVGPVVDYLTLCVRVKEDLKRPIPVLQKFALRPDVWLQMREDVLRWVADLRALDARDLKQADVAAARKLIDEGRASIAYASDRRALVHYLVASRILHGVVSVRRDPGPDVAEAYYLLGAVESRIGPAFWASPAAFYLEMAVRLAPGSDVAREAFALLEEETLLGFTGSGGLSLPDEERARLDELRELAEAGRSRQL